MYERETWVYLDHWAVRHFATADGDRSRLLAALQNTNTLVLVSGMNAVDLLGNEGESVAQIDRLCGAIGSRWRALDVQPQAVIERVSSERISPREAVLLDLAAEASSFSLENWVASQSAARAEARASAQAI